jgi:hypothetical protein
MLRGNSAGIVRSSAGRISSPIIICRSPINISTLLTSSDGQFFEAWNFKALKEQDWYIFGSNEVIGDRQGSC